MKPRSVRDMTPYYRADVIKYRDIPHGSVLLSVRDFRRLSTGIYIKNLSKL